MAGRGRKKGEEISSKSKAWKVGVYGRRSFDDGETEESYTITNQKKMIEYFVSNYYKQMEYLQIAEANIKSALKTLDDRMASIEKLFDDAPVTKTTKKSN